MVAVETKCDSEGQGSGKAPAIVGAPHSEGKHCLDGALSVLPDTYGTFGLYRTVTFFKLPRVLSPFIHSSHSFEVHQGGGGLPVVQMNSYQKVGKIS